MRKNAIFLRKKNAKNSQKTRKFFGGGMLRLQNKYGKEIINYDIIKLLMLSSQTREFHKFFCAINCCSYRFSRNFFSRNIATFRFVFAFFCLIYFREKMRNFAKKFAKYEPKFSHFFNFFAKVFVCWKPYATGLIKPSV